MGKYILKRILIMIPVLLMVSFFSFLIINMAPGDPADLYVSPDMTQAQIELTRQKLGLNQPLLVRYGLWLWNTVQGDLGFSFQSRIPVTQVLPSKISATVQLMLVTLVFSYLIGIPLGVLSAKYKNSWFDNLMTGFNFLGVSIPNFFLGLGLIYIFSLKLKLLPTGGMVTLGPSGGSLGDRINHLILPVIVLSTFYISNMTRYVRSSMIDIFQENYMRTAVAKGLPQRKVLLKHGLRNSLVPIITIISSDIPKLLGGAVVTEQIFNWPGIGQLMMLAINSRDYPMLMAINLLAAVAVLIFNLIADIMYAVVDPRIRY